MTPEPESYCSVWHGQALFPHLVPTSPDPHKGRAIVIRFLCRKVGRAGMPCDPGRCAAHFDGAAPPELVVGCKKAWADYQGGDGEAPAWQSDQT